MVEVTRVGNVIVLEYFSADDKRVMNGYFKNKKESKRYLQLMRERDAAFLEIRKAYEENKPCGKDPLHIEPDKYRNRNALANPFLRF